MRLPAAVDRRILDRSVFQREGARYAAMPDAALLLATKTCLRNLARVDATIATADADLQLVLVPELWERLTAGTRDDLRRISSTLAEYDPTAPSIFATRLSADTLENLRARARALRGAIARAAALDTTALVEWTRFAIAGSRAASLWAPEDCVYEPGFTYRLVPAIVRRLLARGRATARLS